MENTNANQTKKEKSKKRRIVVAILIVIIVIIILLLRSCGTQAPPPVDTTPLGSYEVGDKRDEVETDEPIKEMETITFTGVASCEVSSAKPEVYR